LNLVEQAVAEAGAVPVGDAVGIDRITFRLPGAHFWLSSRADSEGAIEICFIPSPS
jgi:hypothetical protein